MNNPLYTLSGIVSVLSICAGLQFLFLTFLKRLNKFFLPIYVTLISFSVLNLPLAVLYALAGVYYYEIKVLFSEMVLSSWVAHIVSIAGIILCMSSIGGESKRAQLAYAEINKKNGDPDEVYFSANQLSNISIITSTNGVWLIAISYIVCLAFPFLAEKYFAGIPEFLAELWIK